MRPFADPPRLPDTGESPVERFARSAALAGTPGAAYVERRGIPLDVASGAGVRFDPGFGGRPAVVVEMRDRGDVPRALHGRYIEVGRRQDKMLTVGVAGGVVGVLGGWRAAPLILVEGLFDALSLAACGFACVATVGRSAPWLCEVASGRTVYLAFDAGKAGEAEAARFARRLPADAVRRIAPPGRAKDWNTALVRKGRWAVESWLREHLPASGTIGR
jgi:hypothetical protein